MVAFSAILTVSVNANDTFGLGTPKTEPIAVSTGETFGLTSNVVVIRQAVVVQKKRQPVTPVRSLIPVVRRAAGSWMDASVGVWTQAKLSAHLRGEIASSQHRGAVPISQIDGRSVQELLAIHDNLHEGWSWDGSTRVRTVTVQRSTVQPSCPSGVCPTPSRQRVVLFRR
jgi:hypothetical protein